MQPVPSAEKQVIGGEPVLSATNKLPVPCAGRHLPRAGKHGTFSREKMQPVQSAGNKQPVPSAGKMQPVPRAGKHATSAKRGKMCNRC